jgi:hypothetical protein
MDEVRRGLLLRLIDHAPLFPPASLPMDESLAEDRAARESEYGWMLNRFVCPASRLDDLGEPAAPLSVVLDGPLGARVASLETRLTEPRPNSADLLRSAKELRRLSHEVYFELVLGERWRDSVPAAVGAIAAVGGRVKLRCGGDAVPSAEQVALVLVSCRQAGVAMKATAGLHHPLPHGGEHGFLNVLCAATLADAGDTDTHLLADVIATERLDQLPFGDFMAEDVRSMRRRLFKAIGSCSWREPVDELRELGWLP